jgi:hypothetical protein
VDKENMMLWTDFLAQTRRELGEPVEGVWADDSLLVWADEAAQDIARIASPLEDEQYQTSTANQATYSLPDGTTEVIAVYFDGRRIPRSNIASWESTDLWDEYGTPRYYVMEEDSIRLIPIPDEAKEIRFFRRHYPASISTDMPYESRYDVAIRYYLLRRAMEAVNDYNAANEYAARYADELSKVHAQEIRERNSGISASPREVW